MQSPDPTGGSVAAADLLARPYGGIRIIDLTFELGCYAARLFSDLGAEVVRIEPLGPAEPHNPRRAAAHAFLNIGKKSVALDLGSEAGLAVLDDLLATAAVVLIESDPAHILLTERVLASVGPRVVTAISYFGLTGPFSAWQGSDLVAQALGGIAWLSGEPGKAPLRIAGEQSRFVTSLYAAAATAIALWDTEEHGGHHVLDVSAQECIAHSLQNAVQVYDLEHRVLSRGGEGTRDATEAVFPCKDGYISLATTLSLPASWIGLRAWMKEAGYAQAARLDDPDWQDRPLRATQAYKDEFRRLFEPFIADMTRQDLVAEALRRKFVLAPVSRLSELPRDAQLMYRRYFQQVADPLNARTMPFPGAPYHLSEPLWSIAGGVAASGAHTADILAGLPRDARRHAV